MTEKTRPVPPVFDGMTKHDVPPVFDGIGGRRVPISVPPVFDGIGVAGQAVRGQPGLNFTATERMVLPPGMKPVTFMGEFSTRFPTVRTDMLEHLAKVAHVDSIPEAEHVGATLARMEAEGKIQFAITPTGEPAVFSSRNRIPDDERKLADALVTYFDSTGTFDETTGEVVSRAGTPVAATLDEWLAEEYPEALDVFSRELTVSRRVVREILDRWVNAGVLEFVRSPQGRKDGTFAISGLIPNGWPVFASRTERGLKEIFERQFRMLDIRTGADGVPLVQEHHPEHSSHHPGTEGYSLALSAQFAALVRMEKLVNLTSDVLTLQAKLPDWAEQARYAEMHSQVQEWVTDVRLMRGAATFCWFEDQTLAVEYAASSCPDSVRLTREMSDMEAGWWYYLVPRPIRTITDATVPIAALLWGWVDNGKKQGLRITAMVPAADGTNVSTVGFWPEGMTIAQAVQEAQFQYRVKYRDSTENLIGEEATIAAIEWMFRFYWMGCFWMKQRIPVLVQQGMKPQIPRQERKRMERVFQRPLGDIQVIHLRRKESVHDPNMPAEERERAREYGCRWVVKGFVRNQYYPSIGMHKPLWIPSYVKGPADKPMRVPTHTVYVVNR